MSYEGYEEYLCEHGHHIAQDCYESEPAKCFECGSPMAWFNSVDQTNGYDPECAYTYEAAKAIIGSDDKWHNDHHGNRYASEVRRFCPAPGSRWRRLRKHD